MCSIDVLPNKKIYEKELSSMKGGEKKLIFATKSSLLFPG